MVVGIIGVGRIGRALIEGFIETKALDAKQIIANDRNIEKLRSLHAMGVQTVTKNSEVAKEASTIIISVKPKDVSNVLYEIKEYSIGKLIISVAAGIETKSIEKQLEEKARVIRVMPNIACTVRECASVYCMGRNATYEDEQTVKNLFGAVGIVFRLPESLMDAVTGLSGSGPAYYFYIIKALAEAGIKEGLPEDIAIKLASQTAIGAGKIVLQSKMSLDELIKMVCSPGGTTIEGLKALTQAGVEEGLKKAVKWATNRSKELSM